MHLMPIYLTPYDWIVLSGTAVALATLAFVVVAGGQQAAGPNEES